MWDNHGCRHWWYWVTVGDQCVQPGRDLFSMDPPNVSLIFQVPGQWRDWSECVWGGGVTLGGDKQGSHALQAPGEQQWQMWRLGPGRPPFISTSPLPSGLVSSSPCPGLSAACLLRRGRLPSITLPSSLYKYKHNRHNTDFHPTEQTVNLVASPVRQELTLCGINYAKMSNCAAHVHFFLLCHYNIKSLSWFSFIGNVRAFRSADI